MVVLNYIKYKPEFVNLTLIQTDISLYNGRNLDENDIPWPINFDIIEIKAKKGRRPLLNILSSFRKNKNLLQKYNIVYFPVQFASLPFKKDKGQVFILGGHGTPTFEGRYKKLKILLYKYIYRKIDSYHQLYVGEGVDYYYKGNIFTFPNGIDTKTFHPLKYKINQNKFLFVGRLEESKGVKISIESWKKARKYNEASLTIVGNGPLKNYVEDNLKYNIIYKSNISILELSDIYRNSDYFLAPTTCDNFPMVTIEALSSGLYVICSILLKKIYIDYKQSINLEFLEANIEVFCKRIEEIVEKKPTWDRAAQYEFINENFAWEEISRKFYNKVVNVYNHFNH